MTRSRGIVYLVGAGPGDPDLITRKGLRCLRSADVVVHDRLVSPLLIEEAPASARRIDVGKAPSSHPRPQSRINALLVAEARRRRTVVRLKGGDPFVFGRGGEECEALSRAGVSFEIVPGVTSATAVPAYAGIPVTHRDRASCFAVVAGHAREDEEQEVDWEALSRIDTLVILMGLGRLPEICARLCAAGRAADTPVAVVSRGATSEQVVVRGDLRSIVQKAAGLPTPATIVVGAVVGCADRLAWFAAGAREDVVA